MKNNRVLVGAALVLVNIAVWFGVLSGAGNARQEYAALLENGRQLTEDRLYEKAAASYTQALSIRDTAETRQAIIDLYGLIEDGYREIPVLLGRALDSYPENSSFYEQLASYHYERGAYKDSAAVINEAVRLGASTEKLTELKDAMRYLYTLEWEDYEEVRPFAGGAFAVKKDGFWGFISPTGSVLIGIDNDWVTSMFNGKALVSRKGQEQIINSKKEKEFVRDAELTSAGVYGSDLFPVEKDGKYYYMTTAGEYPLGPYDYAGGFNGGMAAVRQGEAWMIVNPAGETLYTCRDIVLDGLGLVTRTGTLIIGDESGYGLYDREFNRIGNFQCDEIQSFTSDGLAAFRQDSLWGFIDREGIVRIEPAYSDAVSFSGGLAGVCNEAGKWGFIDMLGNLVIEYGFDEVSQFTDTGSCFVRIEEAWKLLCFETGGM